MPSLTRRAVTAGLLTSTSVRLVRAEPAPLQVLAHRVHQTVATGAQGGDIVAAWTKQTGVPVQWTTFDIAPLGERLLREASLDSTSVDVGFLVNTELVPRVATLFEPLDARMASDPIEDPPDIFAGLMSGMRVADRQVGLPFRHASSGLHVNTEILAEHGFSKPPATIEELAEVARACTGRRNGQPVVGLVLPGVAYPNVIDLARAWNGDFVTTDYRCVADGPGMLNAIRMLRALFQAGAFPRNFAALGPEDVNTWMQQGRAAMCLQSMGRNRIFNDPAQSKFAGKIATVAVPISAEFRDSFDVAPAKVEFWGMAIPKGAGRKDLSWSFMKAMLTKNATLAAALNGNGPVRQSTYDNPMFRTVIPYADEERRVLRVARLPLPAFDDAARAADIFKEQAEAAVLGLKTPEAAMAEVVQRVSPMLART